MNHDSTSKDELDSELDLDVAVKRAYRNIVSGCFPNRLDAAILKNFPNQVKERVEELLLDKSMDWANGSARYFDLPKQDGLVRPICFVEVDVAVAYQALVDATSEHFEPYIDTEFGGRIFSHRLRTADSEVMFQPPSDAHKAYIQTQHNLANSGKYSHCLRLDIANYYERIYHHKLQQLLERRKVPGTVTSALCKLLRKFSSGDSHGIPQGFWASDYIGVID